jgi:hypothetical protein
MGGIGRISKTNKKFVDPPENPITEANIINFN